MIKKKPMQLPFNFAKKQGVFIAEITDDVVKIVHRAEVLAHTLIELRRCLQKPLQLKMVKNDEFESLLTKAYEAKTECALAAISGLEADMDIANMMKNMPTVKDLLESEDDAPIIQLINAIIMQAIKQNTSDIHFETFEDKLIVRYRIDGILQEVVQPPRVLAPLLISRLKIMAKLDIAEKRLPQDGRISLRIAGRAIDVRVSTIPTHYGERIVLRLLDKQAAPLDLARLGMSTKALPLMQELIAKPHGILLVTGPTGSGKTTTLYAALTVLNESVRNILTVEDPIEYYLPGIGQTQVNPKIGMTFAKGLRAILRQDPDVVMVGEIRDLETVEMAIQASLTGHLVMSTLHTNSAIGAITRLRDMGAESFLISSTVIGVVAQRLVRVLCDFCKSKEPITAAEKILLNLAADDSAVLYKPVGCEQCKGLGYTGRTGIYELIAIDDNLRKMIHDNDSEGNMEKYARQHFPSIREDGWRKALSGKTSVAEVLRVTAEGL